MPNYKNALQEIANTKIWGDRLEGDLREIAIEAGEYDGDAEAYEPSSDTESTLLYSAVEIARKALEEENSPLAEYNTADAESILGMGDQFLADWEIDAGEGGEIPEDRETVKERRETWDQYRPLFVAAPRMLQVLRLCLDRGDISSDELGQEIRETIADFKTV